MKKCSGRGGCNKKGVGVVSEEYMSQRVIVKKTIWTQTIGYADCAVSLTHARGGGSMGLCGAALTKMQVGIFKRLCSEIKTGFCIKFCFRILHCM